MRNISASPVYTAALAANGFAAGRLYASVVDHQKPVLCAACHASEALATGGYPGVPPLTTSMHSLHANVIAPDTGLTLNDSRQPHLLLSMPSRLGDPLSAWRDGLRRGGRWLGRHAVPELPWKHERGRRPGAHRLVRRTAMRFLPHRHRHPEPGPAPLHQRLQSRRHDPPARQHRSSPPIRTRPPPGISLYRFSNGHGDLQCSACHGSTHAIYPSIHRNDNLQSQQLQGHAGTLANCTTCHNSMPQTAGGGPHGMHSIDSTWARDHGDRAENDPSSCRACHGSDNRGTPLSRVFVDHSVTMNYGTKNLTVGREVSCYDCHNGPNSESNTTHTAPVVSNATLAVPADGSASVQLTATGSAPEFRILRQPAHGTVALAGKTATYFPDPGFSGPDSFLFTASDAGGYIDAWSPATVSVTVGNPPAGLDRDGDQLPDIVEYALGLSPDFPTAADARTPFFQNIGGTNYWTLRIPRAPSPADSTAIVEFSSDLATWVPGIAIVNTPFLLEVRDPDPALAHASRYVRIRASR